MTHQDSETTRLLDYIVGVLPWAQGHQLKGGTPFVCALIEKQSGNHAEVARGLGNQEAAGNRRSRLLHNERWVPPVWPTRWGRRPCGSCRPQAKCAWPWTGRSRGARPCGWGPG
jgi:hypothetical protein